ncbi:PriCT-2 domain-containing protein [Paraburkholderia heleia]|uniref:PriCT-2 domain-containing protein n=1 Tax=Paraburkholderia heleia TaxID=634127 RepID=UPI002AB62C12|nr:PriCT-2 domain-containing protein [Paraburkholderia heleia]
MIGLAQELDRARSALFSLDAGGTRADWIRIGMAAKAAGMAEDDFIDWSAQASNFGGERETRTVWRSFRAGGGITAGTLFHAALDAGWNEADASVCRAPRRSAFQTRFAEPERTMRETLDPRWLAYWHSLGPVRDVGRAYLEARRCVVPPADGDLRFDAMARHPGGYAGPALVALVTDAVSRTPISLHRTWVNAEGSKAPVEPPRLLLGGHRKAGGVIRLWPDEAVTSGLGIAEGIETALSLAHGHSPVWACIDAGNLARFLVQDGIESLTIATDNDIAGTTAANDCAELWAMANRDVTLVEVLDGA